MAGSNREMRRIAAIITLPIALAFAAAPSQGQSRATSGRTMDAVAETPSQEAGWEILQRFRSMGWPGGYHWRIQLKIMPRREKSRYVSGTMYGAENEKGPISRIDIVEDPPDVDSQGNLVEGTTLRLLLQSGNGAYALQKRSNVSGPPLLVDAEAALEGIAGSDFSLFDLMAPFIYWQRFEYEGKRTFRGGPTHVFLMRPPENDALLKSLVGGVRIYLSDQFNALTQSEIYGVDGTKLKTMYISGVKRVDGHAIFSGLDVRNEITRDKTRLRILDAEMGLRLPGGLFEAQSLMEDLQSQTIPSARQEAFQDVE